VKTELGLFNNTLKVDFKFQIDIQNNKSTEKRGQPSLK